MNTPAALSDLSAIEASLYRLRCITNSMAAGEARMARQIASCRRLAGDALALLEEASD